MVGCGSSLPTILVVPLASLGCGTDHRVECSAKGGTAARNGADGVEGGIADAPLGNIFKSGQSPAHGFV